jgi:FAD/FMN-containing dehydrogenase
MRRKYGLSSDNLIAADVVTADGSLVHASDAEDPDLFWALKGAGWDLGVVVNFEYRAHPLGPEVWVPFVAYAWSDAKQVIQRYRDFAVTAPEGLSSLCVCWTVPEIDAFPQEHWGEHMVVILGPYIGPIDEGRDVARNLPSFGTVIADLSGVMPWTEAQLLFDEDYPKGRRYYWRSTYLTGLPDTAIDALIAQTEQRPSLLSSLDIWQLGGAIDRVGPTDTPIAHRAAPFLIGIEANWEDPADDDANRDWTKAVSAVLEPFSAGGSYMNFEDPDDAAATAAAYGANLDRLRAVKQRYDPNNLFRSRRGLG